MNIIQIVGIAILSVIIIILLKQYKPEYALQVSILCGTIILFFAFEKVSAVIKLLDNLVENIGINKEFFRILLKITGIAYLIEFASMTCKDAGESAIASKVELAGKLLIITISMPIISTLLETIVNVI